MGRDSWRAGLDSALEEVGRINALHPLFRRAGSGFLEAGWTRRKQGCLSDSFGGEKGVIRHGRQDGTESETGTSYFDQGVGTY
jgi:hypothetical protein